MSLVPRVLICLAGALCVGLCAAPAWADEAPTGRGVVPLQAPPGARQVPVPDVRGLSEAAAARALTEAGLRLGGVERVGVARLRAELGRTYVVGQVVQQAPRPSTGNQPSWLARGAPVWLRSAAPTDEGVIRAPTQPTQPRVPVQPTQPRVPVQPTQPDARPRAPLVPVEPYPYRGTPPVPPPPYDIPGSQRPVVQQPPIYDQPVVQQPPIYDQPVVQQPPPFQDPGVQAPPSDGLFGDIRARVGLPCERRQERWHLRPVGGAAFSLGDDSGDGGFYAGVDFGRTFSGCFGVDVFYRYADSRFDRDVPGGILEDAGGFHNIGIKGTYNASIGGNDQLFWWIGLGVSYFLSTDLQNDDEGVAGYGEVGIGYMLSNTIRIRLGANVHAMDTDAGRFLAANDTKKRLLWIVAPTLSVELDL